MSEHEPIGCYRCTCGWEGDHQWVHFRDVGVAFGRAAERAVWVARIEERRDRHATVADTEKKWPENAAMHRAISNVLSAVLASVVSEEPAP